MNFLFVHQNFPGQFRHIASLLALGRQHRVVGLGDQANLKQRPDVNPNIEIAGYSFHPGSMAHTHHYVREYEGHVRRGQQVARAAMELKQKGVNPEVVIAHPGWGEALFLRDVFPDARHISHFEYFYQSRGADMGFDPEFPSDQDAVCRVRIKNSTQLQALADCDAGVSPTLWQKSRYPKEFQSKIKAIHEGIDTRAIKPDASATLKVGKHVFKHGDEIVTYAARNLEPYRGFHSFMRSLGRLQRLRPQAHVLIVGGDNVSYGRHLAQGQTYREIYCREIQGLVDWSRIHFLGKLAFKQYLKVLQVSAAHVYLTYPFVLSWSMLEAMSAGCVVIGSATAPVKEVISDGENGVLVDFFSPEQIANAVAAVLADPMCYTGLRTSARATVIKDFDLHTRCLPQWLRFVQETAGSVEGVAGRL